MAKTKTSFKKGHEKKGGRLKGTPNQRTLLLEAIKEIEREEKLKFWPTVLRLAIKLANSGDDTALLREVIRKLVPDMVEHGGMENQPVQIYLPQLGSMRAKEGE